jgi:cytochrome d ubiquinol oxidase subunit I
VALGTILSAFWILAANSWMQTPAGYKVVDGKFMVTDFSSAIFNPSTLTRTGHMAVASFETAAFVVAGISAYFLLKGRQLSLFRRSLGIALAMAALFSPLQIYLGDLSGRQVFHHQPAKLAAIEAHWKTNVERGAPFAVIALPDMKKERNLFEVAIPNGLSLLVTHSLNGRVQGLKEFPREDRPNVFILFWSFRLMVAIGFVLFFVMVWAAFLCWKESFYVHRPFLWTLVIVHPFGFLATELGWITNEVGRQPWVVYNLIRTAEGISPIPVGNVIWSLSLFLIILPVIGAIYFFYLLKTLQRGPDLSTPIPPIQRMAGLQPLEEIKSGMKAD